MRYYSQEITICTLDCSEIMSVTKCISFLALAFISNHKELYMQAGSKITSARLTETIGGSLSSKLFFSCQNPTWIRLYVHAYIVPGFSINAA
jgi:hypothetical protein